MAHATAQPFTDHMQALFTPGPAPVSTDRQLLERFLAGRDEAGELAFEALVAHHGPMVMRVCRNVLDDPHDVHHAFQVFSWFWQGERMRFATANRSRVGCTESPCE